MTTSCPCGSGRPLADCCGRYHAGTPAPTAEALMRSRYSAFVLGLTDYILATWHPGTRPETVDPAQGPRWLGLEILDLYRGNPGDGVGEVEFRARYREGGRAALLHERSRFVREGERWFYLQGEIRASAPAPKTGRNGPCPCGSGKKFKRCCG